MFKMTQKDIYNYIKKHQEQHPQEVIDYLVSQNFLKDDIEFIYEVDFDISLKKETIEERERRLDTKFKKEVRERYHRCVISEHSQTQCDVIHLLSFSESNEYQKYDPNNGLLMDKSLHSLFDKYYFTINPENNQIELNLSKEDIEETSINQYKNKKLDINPDSKIYLERHYQTFLSKLSD